jgi:hypothetical protein
MKEQKSVSVSIPWLLLLTAHLAGVQSQIDSISSMVLSLIERECIDVDTSPDEEIF